MACQTSTSVRETNAVPMGVEIFFLIFNFLKTDHLTKKRSFHNSLPTQYTCTLFFELYVEKQERTMFNKILIMVYK